MITDEDLDAALRASAPVVDTTGAAPMCVAMAEEVAQTRRRGLFASRRRRLAAAAAAAVVFVPGAAFAVGRFVAETGTYGKPGYTENDTSQYINMCAPDIGRYVATLAPTRQPLPPGTTWGDIRAKLLAEWQRMCPPHDSGLVMQVTGIKVQYLLSGQCPWEQDFLHAGGPGATDERRRAAAAIAGADDAVEAIGGWGDDNWKAGRDKAARGDAAWIAYDYQVNCLGRNTAANPPTVADPK